MKHRYAVLFLIPAFLLAGVFIYSSQRSSDIYLNQWLANIGDGRFFAFLQSLDLSLPGWVVYSLPDGLWMLALITLILLIWDFKLDRKSLPWISMAIVTGICFELFQGLHWIRGSFDILDLILVLSVGLIPVFFLLIKNRRFDARQDSIQATSKAISEWIE